MATSAIVLLISIVLGVLSVAWISPTTASGSIFLAVITSIVCFLVIHVLMYIVTMAKSSK